MFSPAPCFGAERLLLSDEDQLVDGASKLWRELEKWKRRHCLISDSGAEERKISRPSMKGEVGCVELGRC